MTTKIAWHNIPFQVAEYYQNVPGLEVEGIGKYTLKNGKRIELLHEKSKKLVGGKWVTVDDVSCVCYLVGRWKKMRIIPEEEREGVKSELLEIIKREKGIVPDEIIFLDVNKIDERKSYPIISFT